MAKIVTLFLLFFFSLAVNAQKFDVDTIMYSGDPDVYINFVFLGDGYLESEIPKFISDVERGVDGIFNKSPYVYYKNFFNVFAIKVPSNESGPAPDIDNLIDNYFGSAYGHRGITRKDKFDNVIADNFPNFDQIIMLVNAPDTGGSASWLMVHSSTHPTLLGEILLHELGHAFGNLADEYWSSAHQGREAANLTQETELDKLKWRNWFGEFGIGLYGWDSDVNPTWYRPHQSCIMRQLNNPFCRVCTEALINKIYSWVMPLKFFEPYEQNLFTSDFPIEFKLDMIEPEPNTLKRVWMLNDNQFDVNKNGITLTDTDLGYGTNKLRVTIEDTTHLLRPINPVLHMASVTWEIEYAKVGLKSISSNKNEYSISYYPNPFISVINFKFKGKITEDMTNGLNLEIYDLKGNLCSSAIINRNITTQVNLDYLPQGVYITKFYHNDNFLSSKKIIKLK
jgi:hypothetical protein